LIHYKDIFIALKSNITTFATVVFPLNFLDRNIWNLLLTF